MQWSSIMACTTIRIFLGAISYVANYHVLQVSLMSSVLKAFFKNAYEK
jgi:hypothetical protein